MKVIIYYGGRGVPDDPCLYVLDKFEMVLRELRVDVSRINIFEHKNSIATLPATMKDADGVILASTVEWLGLGGYMYEFLDALWLYGDQEQFSKTYMQAVVLSTTYGEREGQHTLEKAWETLGGLPCEGLCGFVEDLTSFKENPEYTRIIEKKAENLYRTISQKTKGLPTSNQAVTRSVLRTQQLELSPQESEQLSKFVSNDDYVQTQKADIADLTSMFRDMMGQKTANRANEFVDDFTSHFRGAADFEAKYLFMIEGKDKPLYIYARNGEIDCHYGKEDNIDVYMKLSEDVMDHIVAGRETFQRAFSVGDMTAKGNFRTLRMLDEIFTFSA